MAKHTRLTRIMTVAIATATAVVCGALSAPNLSSMPTPAGTQGGSNPPWFPSLMAFEHYDSGRTKLFEHAHFTGSFARDNVVDVRLSPDEYPTPYNVVYRSGHSLFVFGGAYGDRGGTGSFVTRVDPQTLQTVWFNQLINTVETTDAADFLETKAITEGDDGGIGPGDTATCAPNQVAVAIPPNTGGYFPNAANKYIAAPDLCFKENHIVVVRGKGAPFPDTYNGAPVWQPAGQFQKIALRYWSLCNNEQEKPYPVVQCIADWATKLDIYNF